MIWWMLGVAVVVVLLFRISQFLKPIAAYFARRADRDARVGGIESQRWRDYYE